MFPFQYFVMFSVRAPLTTDFPSLQIKQEMTSVVFATPWKTVPPKVDAIKCKPVTVLECATRQRG